MKALLLLESEDEAALARSVLEPLGFEALHYRNPLKALDNLDEIRPDAIVASAEDYPRHWKIIVDVVRAEREKKDCVVVLVSGERFGIDEAAKASHLGVNGVLRGFADRRERARFERLLKRYVEVEDCRASYRYVPGPRDRLGFAFSHPATLRPVFGRLDTISATGLSFAPSGGEPALAAGEELGDCTLRVGDALIGLSCTVVRAGGTLGLKIAAMEAEGPDRVAAYIARAPDRELRAAARGESS